MVTVVRRRFYTDANPPTPSSTKHYFYSAESLEVEVPVGSIFVIIGAETNTSIIGGSYSPLESNYGFNFKVFSCYKDTTIEFS